MQLGELLDEIETPDEGLRKQLKVVIKRGDRDVEEEIYAVRHDYHENKIIIETE